MLVLDTDHLSELERDSAAGQRLARRLEANRLPKVVTIVNVEEQLRGWLAELSRHHDPHRQIIAYDKLQRQIETFANWVILPWDGDSADMIMPIIGSG